MSGPFSRGTGSPGTGSPGTGSPGTGGPGPGSPGTPHDTTRFDAWLRKRLAAKPYQELRVGPEAHPVRLAFRWPGSAAYVPRVVAVVDVGERPAIKAICKRLEPWFEATVAHGPGGDCLLLFLDYNPSAHTIEDIKGATFYAGNASVAVGAYDMAYGKHWISQRTECQVDIFGE